jgi:2C-methyl-D-erythritol 2,4-cyclodiphosphate synthase
LLPFLKPKHQGIAGIVVKMRKPDEKDEGDEIPEESDDKDAAIHACADDLIKAVHSQDIKGVAEALRSAFEIMDSEPHEEGPHVEPHSYEAQNQKAGEE